jgi:hypothetical protein
MKIRMLSALLLAMLASACAAAPAPATDDPEDVATSAEALTTGHAYVVPQRIPVFGRSITRWTEEYWRWLSSVPASQNPDLDENADCGVGQDGPIFFVPPLPRGSVARTCRVPFGKPALVPLQAVLDSYPCPDPTFEPAPGQSLEDFLEQGATFYDDLYTGLVATVDGTPVDLSVHRHTTPLFTNDVDPSLPGPLGDACLTGSPQPAVSDGWFAMILLTPGTHDVVVTGTGPGGQPVTRTWHLVVGHRVSSGRTSAPAAGPTRRGRRSRRRARGSGPRGARR